MGRRPSSSSSSSTNTDRERLKMNVNRGAWTATEDEILTNYITLHGEGKWRNIPKLTGLKRCGKSCRLRWLNYLKPDIKRGNISPDEEELIIRLHNLLGNRWSLIAGRLPGRTDNEIKNYWNTTLSKKIQVHKNLNKTETNYDSHKTSSHLSTSEMESPTIHRPSASSDPSQVLANQWSEKMDNYRSKAETYESPLVVNNFTNRDNAYNRENDSSNFIMMDVNNKEEFRLSDLLNPDSSCLCGFPNDNYQNESLVFPDDLLHECLISDDYVKLDLDSNLNSFASFSDIGGDWLGGKLS